MPDASSSSLIADCRRIAVLRANRIGDFIVTLPALDALRGAYPEAEIVLLGRAWHAELLAGRPGPVDRVVPLPAGSIGDESGTAPDPIEHARFFGAMTAERFDLAIQLHGGGRESNPFVLRLGAATSVGLRTADAAPLDRWVRYEPAQLEILRHLEVVSLVGAKTSALEPRLAVTEADLAEARFALPEDDRPLVAIHPGAIDPRRRWPVEKFAEVGDRLVAVGAKVVVTGTQHEADLVRGVVNRMRRPAVGLSGRLTLGGLAGLLSRCAVVVSNDSGPLHLAAAVGAATVGVYWCENLMNWGPLTRARRRTVTAWRLSCSVRGEERGGHDASLVADVPTADVAGAALDLLLP